MKLRGATAVCGPPYAASMTGCWSRPTIREGAQDGHRRSGYGRVGIEENSRAGAHLRRGISASNRAQDDGARRVEFVVEPGIGEELRRSAAERCPVELAIVRVATDLPPAA